ncbi:hypothetical protein C7401_15439 [Paraburkholderia unamae]|uniref:hypothetical protein n=1 Tax=Paraburkholderia unamae TaxID=219649 RepID=UPI000DC605F3|nr:hypothetical protein [Paraburkholderia unamae]RAR47998.1 hypothetical protein C7401_15439 [Paraburkholderia unamae]
MPLKILVIHSTGLVGKSIITASLLHPRLSSPRIFSVERQNQDAARYGIDVSRYRSADFKKLINDVVVEPGDLVVDVGASQYADFMKEFARVRGAINDFDVVIVPTTPDGRVQEETLGTIETLLKVGLQPDKLRVVFNRATIDQGDSLETEFEHVVAHLIGTPSLPFYEDLVTYENPIHSELRAEGLSFEEVATDTTDYRKLVSDVARKSPNSAVHRRLVGRLNLQRAVASATSDLDAAFVALRLPGVQIETDGRLAIDNEMEH